MNACTLAQTRSEVKSDGAVLRAGAGRGGGSHARHGGGYGEGEDLERAPVKAPGCGQRPRPGGNRADESANASRLAEAGIYHGRDHLEGRIPTPIHSVARKTAFRSLVGTVSRTHVNPPASFISRAPLRNAARARRDNADALDARLGELGLGDGGVGRAHHDVQRLAHRTDDGADRRDVAKARRVEHVRAGLLEGLQPPDRVVEVEPPVQQVLRPRGQHEWNGQRPAHLDGGLDPLDGEREVVDRVLRVSGRRPRSSRRRSPPPRPAGSSRPRRGARGHSRSRGPRSRAGRSRRR